METKTELRKRILSLRAGISGVERRSRALWSVLYESPEYADARTVMAFVSVAGEPDTARLLSQVLHDGKVLVLPNGPL